MILPLAKHLAKLADLYVNDAFSVLIDLMHL